MGFTFGIGEFEVESYPEDRYAKERVERPPEDVIEQSPKSSMHNRPKTNYIDTGYVQWFQFTWSVGLVDVFNGRNDAVDKKDWSHGKRFHDHGIDYDKYWDFDDKSKEAITYDHPGIIAIDEDYLTRFKQARDYWEDHPDREKSIEEQDNNRDINMERLNWLVWWTEWALDHCEYPSFVNW